MPRVQNKRGTAANLTSVNPTPLAGELLVVSDENTLKIGNGTDAYTSLAYVTATPRSHTHTLSQIADLNISPAGSPPSPYDVALSYNYSSATWSTKTIGNVGVGSQPIGGWPAGSLGSSLAGKASTTHASAHATGGSDALTPADIGAAPAASPTFTGGGTFTTSPLVEVSSNTGRASPTPTELRLSTTAAGSDWSTTDPWARLGFYSADTSGNGPATQASIDAISTSTAGATSNLVFRLWNGISLATRATLTATGLEIPGVITVAAGSASAPAVCFSGDANTGVAQIGGADTWSVVTAGVERLRVDSGGRVGIGRTPSVSGTSLEAENNVLVPLAKSYHCYTVDYGIGTPDSSGLQVFFGANDSLRLGRRASGTFTELARLTHGGNLLLGGTATPTSAVGAFVMFNGTAPTASVTNGVVLYSEDVSSSAELKVRDEAGNVTTLSPHNFDLIPGGPSEPMAWAYYSERDGHRINVDMLRLARLVERLTGEKLVYKE